MIQPAQSDPIVRQSDNCEALIRLRPMEAADVTFLSELWVESWREAMPDIDFDSRRAWLEDFLGDPMHKTLVAETSGGLQGFVTTESDYLHQLVVDGAAKGTGAAAQLLDAAKSQCGERLMLDVNQGNGRAVRFYLREGFAIDAEGRNPASGLPTWRMLWRRVPPRP